MTLIGRITRDAEIRRLQDERTVVGFSLALNDYYQPKNGEARKFTTYVECAYWRNTKVAERLNKGTLVEITGRLYTRAFISKEGEAKAALHCHISSLKIHVPGKQKAEGKPVKFPGPEVEAVSEGAAF